MTRTTWYTIGRWAAAGLVFLAVLEASSRIEDRIRWGAPILGTYSHDQLAVADSIGRRNRPNARFEKWQINSHGFRGPETTLEKPPGLYRIVTLGVSETFGLYESPGMEYPAQMQHILDQLSPHRYEAINAAVPGLSPPNLTDYFDRWVSRFSPDLVILYLSPVLYLDNLPPRRRLPTPDLEGATNAPALRVVARTRTKLRQFLPVRLQTWVKQAMIRREVRSHADGWVFETVPAERVNLFRDHLQILIDRIEASGSQVILGTNATRFGSTRSPADSDALIGWRKFLPRASEATLLAMSEVTNEVIRTVGRERGIEVVDLANLIPPGAANFADHTHFTDHGATLAAQAFVQAVTGSIGTGRSQPPPPEPDSP